MRFRLLLSIGTFFLLFSPTVFAQPAYTYGKMTKDIHKLAQSYPSIVHVKVIGTTPYHRGIYAIGVGTGKASVVISSSHHAREWITTCVVMKMAASYCNAYETNRSISGYPVRQLLEHNSIWFVPMVNPDGVTLQQRGPAAFPLQMYAKFRRWNKGKRDFTEWKANAQGVDLNLQYDGGWKKIKRRRSPASKGYKGTSPQTAPEVAAMVHFLKELDPPYEVTYHASGNVIFADKASRKRYSVAKDVSDLTGYRLVGIKDSYGGLTDWWNQQLEKVGVTVEVGPFYGERPVPLKYLARMVTANKAIGLYFAARTSAEKSVAVY